MENTDAPVVPKQKFQLRQLYRSIELIDGQVPGGAQDRVDEPVVLLVLVYFGIDTLIVGPRRITDLHCRTAYLPRQIIHDLYRDLGTLLLKKPFHFGQRLEKLRIIHYFIVISKRYSVR